MEISLTDDEDSSFLIEEADYPQTSLKCSPTKKLFESSSIAGSCHNITGDDDDYEYDDTGDGDDDDDEEDDDVEADGDAIFSFSLVVQCQTPLVVAPRSQGNFSKY